MGGFNIRLRIWLSIGIFVFGYLLSTIAGQLERLSNERHLSTVLEVLDPAARRGRDATAAFERLIKGYADSFLLGDSAGLERADVEGVVALERLNSIARLRGISAARAATAIQLASAIQRFEAEARVVYRQVPAESDSIPQELQGKIRRLGIETAELKSALSSFQRDLSQDLDLSRQQMRRQSARMRTFTLILFAATLIVAAILVNLTIQRSIIAPLTSVQSALAHERDLLRILLDNIPDYIYFKDAGGQFIRINRALASEFGLSDPEEARGRSDADYFDAETAARIRLDDQRIRLSGQPLVAKVEEVATSGVSRWMATTKVPVNDGSPSAPLIVGISRDITEWKQTMEELRRSEASFRLLFSAIPHAVFVCDLDTLEIVEVNDATGRIYGYSPEELRSMRLIDLYPASDHERLRDTQRTLDPPHLPHGARKHLAKDGRTLHVEIAVHLLEFHGRGMVLVMAQDVSEQKRLELELRHAQKLEAVGQLATGIAHEINTPIQYVGDNLRFLCDAFRERQAVFAGYERLLAAALTGSIPGELAAEVQAAREKADLDYLAAEIPRAMEQSLDGVERIATIVRAMKSFAHPGSNQKTPADLNQALSDALIVARNELKYVADVVTDLGELPPVWCNLGDLNQVFLNLLVNAAHAIGDVVKETGVRGEIHVRTHCENNRAIISISDTGCGIPAGIQSRVFDQFFTTKEVGKGTGQGLAIARNIIVDRHGGKITFEPNLPRGTTFLVSLPMGETPAPAAGGEQPAAEMALL